MRCVYLEMRSTNSGDDLTLEEVLESLKGMKPCNDTEPDAINSRLPNYGWETLLHSLNVCWKYGKITDKCKTALVTPIFISKERNDIHSITINVLAFLRQFKNVY